jgi:hypothetical protein
MQNCVIEFTYETPWLEKFIHPLLKHLTTTDTFNKKHHFELFFKNDEIVFRLDHQIKGIWTKNETEYIKGRIFIEMINVLFHKSENDWLMTVHASAVTNGNKTILFSADQGSGKTTFAALLLAHGYQVISDDFVPIEKSSFKAYPFPIALSVKEGALELISTHFPELKGNQLIRVSSEKNVKYLPVDTAIMEMIFPVKEIVFIKYDNTVDFQLEKVETVPGIQKLLDEAWIPAFPENVKVFLNSILNISFYKLTYSNNEMAMNAVTQLFENDAY